MFAFAMPAFYGQKGWLYLVEPSQGFPFAVYGGVTDNAAVDAQPDSEQTAKPAAEQTQSQPVQAQGASPPDQGMIVDQPGKLLRIAMMVREMLEEVRRAPLDQDARKHLADVHERVVDELKGAMSNPLADELERITQDFDDDVPTEAQLRIAQAQLLGWLEGLFQGIQAAIATQQMHMASQLEEIRRRSLPPGAPQAEQAEGPTGQYL